MTAMGKATERKTRLRPVKTRPRPAARKLVTFPEFHSDRIREILAAHPELAERIRKATTGRHTLVVQSGPFKYHFSVFRKAGRLKVYRTRVARNVGADALARALKNVYSCRLCQRTFPRKGKEVFCRTEHAVEYKKLKRAGKVWSRTNLSPEAQERKTVAAWWAERGEQVRDMQARREQEQKRFSGWGDSQAGTGDAGNAGGGKRTPRPSIPY